MKNSPPMNDHDEKEFHCASFVVYILINSVEDVRDFFETRGLNYTQMTPSDLTQIPGVQKLFSSTWIDYNKTMEQFINEEADKYIKLLMEQ